MNLVGHLKHPALAFMFVVVGAASPQLAFSYGGEDLKDGRPWHHFDMTLRALTGAPSTPGLENRQIEHPYIHAGFSSAAATSVAWHADNIDSYLYNPTFWLKDGVGGQRTKAALTAYAELAKLHHDDTFTTAGIRDNWKRYSAGALIGLVWAAENNDVAAAHQILGMAAHAVQDFYSHSNWIDDPARRDMTWFEQPALESPARFKKPGETAPGAAVSDRPADGLGKAPVAGSRGNRAGSIGGTSRTGQSDNRVKDSMGDRRATAGNPYEGSTSEIIPEVGAPEAVRHFLWPTLFTGAYEHSERHGGHHHGKFSASCSILNASGVSGPLGEICGGASPLSGFPFCAQHRACTGAARVDLSVFGVSSDSILYMQPPGIAIDSTRIARIGAAQRSLVNAQGAFIQEGAARTLTPDSCRAIVNYGYRCDQDNDVASCSTSPDDNRSCTLDSDYLFASSKRLAILTTAKLFQHLDASMRDIEAPVNDRYEAFWTRVTKEGSSLSQRTAQYEDFSKFPFHFLSAGPYPVANPAAGGHSYAETSDGWYLRLRIRTADESDAGTDADIRLLTAGAGWEQSTVLDYLPTNDSGGRVNSRLFVYNDFERGDNDVYTVGPFPSRPQRIALINDDSNAGDVAAAIWNDFTRLVDHALTDIRRTLISIIGGNADDVGSARRHETHAQIAGRAPGRNSLFIDGGDEGRYRVNYSERIAPELLTEAESRSGWLALEITLDDLECVSESKVDRGSNSDEPYLAVLIAPLNGSASATVDAARFGPFDDVDSGERRGLDRRRFVAKFPRYGGYTIAAQLWESDDESAFDRDEMFKTFVTGVSESVRRGNGQMLDELGKSLASGWKVDEIEATAFYRGPIPELARRDLYQSVGWIEGGQRITRNLNSAPTTVPLRADDRGVDQWNVEIDTGRAELIRDLNRDIIEPVRPH